MTDDVMLGRVEEKHNIAQHIALALKPRRMV